MKFLEYKNIKNNVLKLFTYKNCSKTKRKILHHLANLTYGNTFKNLKTDLKLKYSS